MNPSLSQPMLTIPVAAVSSLVATVIIFALGIISLLYGRRDRIRVTFSVFCFAWGMMAVGATWMQVLGAPGYRGQETVEAITRVLPLGAFLTWGTALHYILALTGYWKRLETRVFFFRLKNYVIVYHVVWVGLVTMLLIDPWVLKGVWFHPVMGYSIQFDLRLFSLMVPFAALDAVGLLLLVKAIRTAGNANLRRFLLQNLAGLVLIKLTALLFIVLLPHFGLPTFVLSFDIFALLAFYFYGIIAHYQYRQIRDFSEGLERMVDERTTELRAAQARLVQSEKMAAMGELVAGVAHEINTPLGAVRSMVDTLARGVARQTQRMRERLGAEFDEDPQLAKGRRAVEDAVRVIDEGTARVRTIVDRLRSFAQLDEADVQRVDLHEGIEDTIGLLEGSLPETVRIERDFGPLPEVICVPRQVNQVTLNLLTNAVRAVGRQGTVTVSTRHDAGWVWVVVEDDGSGIAPEHLERIFDPGFTTRGVGVGTGLGLAIAYQIVEDHGGRMEVRSRPGEGTRIAFVLPVDAGPVLAAHQKRRGGEDRANASTEHEA